MLGMALHNLASAAFILIVKAKLAYKTGLWNVAILAWLSLTGFVVLQIIAIDYISSPYMTGNSFLGMIFLLNYCFNFLTTIFVTALIVIRIRLFYGASTFSYIMYFMGFLTILGKGAGNGIGVVVSVQYIQLIYNSPVEDPLYPKIALVMTFALLFEALFTAIGTLSFLSYLTDFKLAEGLFTMQNKVLKKETGKLFLVIFLNFINASFAVWVAFDDNWISHNGFFMDSLTYTLELYAFIELSYISAKKLILETHKTSTEKSRSHTESKR
ncbi:hypothetical protein HDV01_007593 [Terramyces sp. JEL0728]|nr:hypothetical protein HDV01_007593 [Terramyces sp. JEL0728]